MADDMLSLRRILCSCRTVAIVGLSDQWHRPSHFVGKYLQQLGWRVVPVNPRCDSILGEKCYARLEDIPFPVDMVDVFRKPEDLPPIAASAVAIGARCLSVSYTHLDVYKRQAQQQHADVRRKGQQQDLSLIHI